MLSEVHRAPEALDRAEAIARELMCEERFLLMEERAREFSRALGHPHGKFGIFAHNYARIKTRFMFMRVCNLAITGGIASMCELGFNAGLSALLLLEAAPDATLVSFDLGDIAPRNASRLLPTLYPSRFLGVQFGPSQKTFPAYTRAHEGFACDLAFIDGDKSFAGRLQDLQNVRGATGRRGVRLFFDEVTAQRCLNGSLPTDVWEAECPLINRDPGFEEAARLYDKLSREGMIRIIECDWPPRYRDRDGICMAKLSAMDLSVNATSNLMARTDLLSLSDRKYRVFQCRALDGDPARCEASRVRFTPCHIRAGHCYRAPALSVRSPPAPPSSPSRHHSGLTASAMPLSSLDWCAAMTTAEKNAAAKMHERGSWLRPGRRDQRDFFSKMATKTFQAALLMTAYYPCFWTLEKYPSVSQSLDGGKWICGLAELGIAAAAAVRSKAGSRSLESIPQSPPCVLYSIGSNYDTSFEDHVSNVTASQCEVHIYDPTLAVTKSQKALDKWQAALPYNYHVHAVAITGTRNGTTLDFESNYGGGVHSYPALSLREAMAANNHASATILKFDIDGFDLDLIRNVPWAWLRFGIVLFEVHPSQLDASHVPHTPAFTELHEAFTLLEEAGYRLYSTEPVHGGKGGIGAGQAEMAFIHKDWSPITGFTRRPCEPGSAAVRRRAYDVRHTL